MELSFLCYEMCKAASRSVIAEVQKGGLAPSVPGGLDGLYRCIQTIFKRISNQVLEAIVF